MDNLTRIFEEGKTYFNEALKQEFFFGNGKDYYVLAIAEFDKILNVEPNNASVLAYQADSLEKVHKYAEALKCNEKLIELGCAKLAHYMNKCDCLCNLDRREECHNFFNNVVRRKFSDSDIDEYYASRQRASAAKAKGNMYILQQQAKAAKANKSGCYVATACYGSYDCMQVLTFRNFRDEYLSKTVTGRMFVRIYYALSPSFAQWLKNKRGLNTFIREHFLDKIYNSLKDKY